jgi:hypothetical protein
MRFRALTFVLSAGLFLSSCGSDSNSTDPTSPSSSSPSTGSSTNAPAPAAANRAPGTITIDVAPKGLVLAGATNVTFGASVKDPDGDPLTYTWDFGDETLTTTNAGVAHTFNRERDYRVKVTVSDGKGGTSTAETMVSAGTLDGTWTMETAAHETLRVSLSHNGSQAISGTVSNGLTFSGRVSDPFGVTFRMDGISYCVQAGTYNGTVSSNLNFIDVPGGGCRGFSLRR